MSKGRIYNASLKKRILHSEHNKGYRRVVQITSFSDAIARLLIRYIICETAGLLDCKDHAVQRMGSSSLQTLDRGFDLHSRHIYLCEFIWCLFCPVFSQRPCYWLIPRPRIHALCL
jgi:hypothetical protein